MSDKILEAVIESQSATIKVAEMVIKEARYEILRLRARVSELEAKATDTTEAA